MVETADDTLSAWYGRGHAGAREGTHPARERILFTSRERIRAGDWRVERTPGLPPALREDEETFTPSSVVYELPAKLGSDEPESADEAEHAA